MCLSEMGIAAGNVSLKVQFIPMGIVFGGRRNGGEQVRFYSY